MKEKDKETCMMFQRELIKHSNSKTYEDAVNEWELIKSYSLGEDESTNCICGHIIHNVYVIHNTFNNEELNIGMCCIKYFLWDQVKIQFNEQQELARWCNRLYRFIYNLSYNGMIFDKPFLKELKWYLELEDWKKLNCYTKFKTQFWGIGAMTWNKKMPKYGFYLVPVIKKLCDMYHEEVKQFLFLKTLLNTTVGLSQKQNDELMYWYNQNINKYNTL